MNAYFMDRHDFVPYGWEHLILFSIYSLLMVLAIRYALKNQNIEINRSRLTQSLGFITILQFMKPLIRWQLGIFDLTDDLPLHLCNILPVLMWWAVKTSNRQMFAILFFWVIIGTTQSLFTPTVTETFPGYESFRYWTVHFGLTFAALCGMLVLDWKPSVKDAIISMATLNLASLVMFGVNLVFKSNYWYLMGKPKEETVMDVLGEWPYYLIQLDIIGLLSFLGLAFIIRAIPGKKQS